jgi:hypothetical protein
MYLPPYLKSTLSFFFNYGFKGEVELEGKVMHLMLLVGGSLLLVGGSLP